MAPAADPFHAVIADPNVSRWDDLTTGGASMSFTNDHHPASDPADDPEARELAESVHALQTGEELDRAQRRALAERARVLAERFGDPAALALSLFALGDIRIVEGDYVGAEAELKRALEAAKQLDEKGVAVDVLRSLSRCAFYTRRPEVALSYGTQALQLAHHGGDSVREAAVQNLLGLIYGRLGSFEAALTHLLSGVRLQEELAESPLPSLLNNVGNVYLELGDDLQALHYFRRALDGFRRSSSARDEGIGLGNLGRAYSGLGDWISARDAFRESVGFFEVRDDTVYLAPALARLGTAHAALGETDKARECFTRSLSVLERTTEYEFHDEVLLAAGRFQLERGDFAEAITLLSQALESVVDDEATREVYELHFALAEAYEQQGDLAAALRHFKEYQRVRQEVADSAVTLRIQGMMLQFDVESARQQEEIHRLKHVELARSYEELHELKEKLEFALEELQTSYWHIRKIQEVLPVCVRCGMVKTGDAEWQDVIDYLKQNTLFLSHGYCPACSEKVEADYDLV
jgi:tetratricopeptide (TPR) repeat protein